MANCIQCPPPTGCNCKSTQTCVLIGRSCTSCGDYVCQDIAGAGDSGPSAGATAGQVIGGLSAGLVFAFLLYWFWWKKRRAPSPRLPHSPQFTPNSATLRRTPSTDNSTSGRVRFGDDAKLSGPAPRRSRVMSRLIPPDEKLVELEDGNRLSTLSEKSDNPFDDANSNPRPNSLASSLAEDSANILNAMTSSERVNSTASSGDFSFRSSHSTTNIPIAYIPAHANSMSVQDGMERGPLGGNKRISQISPKTTKTNSIGKRLTALMPRASPNEQEVIAGLPSPTHSSTTNSSTKPKPSRPDREGLDLRLPKIVQPAAAATFGLSSGSPAHEKRASGFPWSAGQSPPATAATAGSRFSSSTTNTYGHDPLGSSLLPAPINSRNPRASDGSMSVMSHMSYILDPPQIVTANSAGRFEVVGHAQARAVQLPSNSPNARVTSEAISLDMDPFADEASAVASRFGGISNDRASFASSGPGDVTIDMTDMNDPRPSRDSAQTEMSIFTSSSRPTTLMTLASRHQSTVSSNPHDSLLDAMPFVPPPNTTSAPLLNSNLAPIGSGSPASPHFPMPPRSPGLTREDYLDPFGDKHTSTQSDLATAGDRSPRRDTTHSEFAVQQATRDNRISEVSSVRTGYQSILEDVPFQIGFPNRNSAWSTASDLHRASTGSYAADRQSVFASDPASVPPVPLLTAEQLQQLNVDALGGQDAIVRSEGDASEERLRTPVMAETEKMPDATPKTRPTSSDPRDSLYEAALLSQQWVEE